MLFMLSPRFFVCMCALELDAEQQSCLTEIHWEMARLENDGMFCSSSNWERPLRRTFHDAGPVLCYALKGNGIDCGTLICADVNASITSTCVWCNVVTSLSE